MKLKGYWYDSLFITVSAVVGAAFALYTAIRGDLRLALFEAVAILAVLVFGLVRVLLSGRRYERMLKKASLRMDYSDTNVLSTLSYPVAVCDEQGVVVWHNSHFADDIASQRKGKSHDISDLIPNQDADGEIYAAAGDKYYFVYTQAFHKDSADYRVFSFIECTDLKTTEQKYNQSRPYAIVIETDNIDDSRSDFRDVEKAEIKSRLEAMVDDWCYSFDSVSKRISDDRLMVITEKSNLERMKADKFRILADVRNYEFKGKNAGVTLSIGVSGGDSIRLAEKGARKALEMAIGRGGDQVALKKSDGSYEFMGGVSRTAEKYSKTRARMRANMLATAIKESSNVIICGHKFSDYDALGSAAGVAQIARNFSIPAFIAIDRNKTLAGKLADRIEASGLGEIMIDGSEAERLINKKTLFVLVDTHQYTFCEYPELFEKCERYAIIDHHRLTATVSEDDKRFYHNPVASSVSEMVAEYMTYVVDDKLVPPVVAEALLAGIMLDTKNFVARTGVRTFQAAAYLKERGADIVAVKKLFSNSMETTKVKSLVISNAEMYKNCVISVVDNGTDNARVIAAQAADDLLNTSGIEASFVMYTDGSKTCISARSLGSVNVQLVMEALGGGGHQTMAACQIADVTPEAAKQMLQAQIDNIQ